MISRAGRGFAAALVVLTLAHAGPAEAQNLVAGRVTQMHGRAMVASTGGDVRRLRKGSVLSPGDTINTASGSFAKIKFSDGGGVLLRPKTRFQINDFADEGKDSDRSVMSLVKGGLRFVSGLVAKRNKRSWKLFTPSATLGIRGTDGAVQADENGTYLLVVDGEITLTDAAGAQGSFVQNQAAFVSAAGGAPQAINPGDSPIDLNNFPSPLDQQPAQDCL